MSDGNDSFASPLPLFIKIVKQDPFVEVASIQLPTYEDYYLRQHKAIAVFEVTVEQAANNTIELVVGTEYATVESIVVDASLVSLIYLPARLINLK